MVGLTLIRGAGSKGAGTVSFFFFFFFSLKAEHKDLFFH
jgi:hypothetical protein